MTPEQRQYQKRFGELRALLEIQSRRMAEHSSSILRNVDRMLELNEIESGLDAINGIENFIRNVNFSQLARAYGQALAAKSKSENDNES